MRSGAGERTAGNAAEAAALTRFSLVLALGAPLLAFSARQAAMYSLPKLFFLGAGACAAWAGLCLEARRRRVLRRTLLDAPLAALWAVLLASAAFSVDGWLSLVGHYRAYFYGLLPLAFCAGLYYACAFSRESRSPGTLLEAWTACGALCAAYAMLQGAGVEPFIGVGRLPEGGRVVSSMGSPVYLGACLLMNVPVALHLVLDREGLRRALGALALLLCSAALFLTLSRGAWLAAAGGAAAYLLLGGRVPFPARTPRGWALLSGGALILLCAVLFAGARVRRASVSDIARVHLWDSALRIAVHRPMLGSGPDTFETALRGRRTEGFLRAMGPDRSQASAHNDFLQAAATLGLPGLLAYLWLLFAVGAACLRALKGPRRREAAAMTGALAGLFLQAKVNPVPLAALAAAAALAGLLEGAGAPGGSEDARPRLSWVPAGLCALLLCGVLGVGRLCAADYHQKRAVVLASAGQEEEASVSWRESLRLNPFETNYRMAFARSLFARAGRASDPVLGKAMIEEAVRSGREAVRRRPGDVDSHQTLGSALLVAGRSGDSAALAEAASVLDMASGMDPYLTPLLKNRILLARLRGEEAKVRELTGRLAALLDFERKN